MDPRAMRLEVFNIFSRRLTCKRRKVALQRGRVVSVELGDEVIRLRDCRSIAAHGVVAEPPQLLGPIPQ
jgi:hypothetical protein